MSHGRNIDIGLAVLCALAKPGQTMTQEDIAEVCGCPRSRIDYLQRKAMRNLKSSHQCQQIAIDFGYLSEAQS